jgi:hypothetical protein
MRCDAMRRWPLRTFDRKSHVVRSRALELCGRRAQQRLA